MPCGIMDQLISVMGQQRQALLIDCQYVFIKPFPKTISILDICLRLRLMCSNEAKPVISVRIGFGTFVFYEPYRIRELGALNIYRLEIIINMSCAIHCWFICDCDQIAEIPDGNFKSHAEHNNLQGSKSIVTDYCDALGV